MNEFTYNSNIDQKRVKEKLALPQEKGRVHSVLSPSS